MRAGSSATWPASGKRPPTPSRRRSRCPAGRPTTSRRWRRPRMATGSICSIKDRQPLGPGILSLDSRAGDIVDRWSAGSVFADALALTGQAPHVSAPSALLAWIKQNDPDRYRPHRPCAGLQGLAALLPDRHDRHRPHRGQHLIHRFPHASLSRRKRCASSDLEDLFDALPPVAHSADIVGHVTAEAAEMTGLAQGHAGRLRPA